MKRRSLLFLFIALCHVVGWGQRINPTTQIKQAPGAGYILESISGGNLVYLLGTAVYQTSSAPVGAPPLGKSNVHVNAVTGAISTWNGSAWTVIGAGSTDLTYTPGANTGTVNSNTGTDATIPAATNLIAGLMTATDKVNFDAVDDVLGVSAGSTNLGTFTGTVIADNTTVKAALQALETKAENGDAVTNGIVGNGATGTPHKLGGTLSENTTVDGTDFNFNLLNSGTVVLESDASSRTHRTEIALTGSNVLGGYFRHINKANIDQSATVLLDLDNTMGMTYQAQAGQPIGYQIVPGSTTALSELSIKTKNVAIGTATTGQVLTLGVGGIAEYQTPAASATDLTYTAAANTGTVNSNNGADATIPAATGSAAGLMTATDKVNFDAIDNLLGVALGSVNLGTFTGTTIADNTTVKAALQALETKTESGDVVANGIVGNGATGTPHKLGGSLSENTTIDGTDFNYNLNNSGTIVLESDASTRTHRTEIALTGSNVLGGYFRHINKSNTNQVATLLLDHDNTMGLTYQAQAGQTVGYNIIPGTTTALSDLTINTKNVALGTATAGQVLTLGAGGVAEYQTPAAGGGALEYNVPVTGANSGSNVRIKGATGATATWTSGTNTLTVDLVGGQGFHAIDWRLVAADVQAAGDPGGATNWVLLRINNTGGNTSIDDIRIPALQKTAIPTSGTLSTTNAASIDVDNNPNMSVVAVGSNSITIRISGLAVGAQGYHLKFVEP
jgi:hypothetical protein